MTGTKPDLQTRSNDLTEGSMFNDFIAQARPNLTTKLADFCKKREPVDLCRAWGVCACAHACVRAYASVRCFLSSPVARL